MTQLPEDLLVWDAHACMPIRPNQDLSALERYRSIGASLVSINVGMDFNPLGHIVRVIAGYRDWIARHSDRFVLAKSMSDVEAARKTGRVAVMFDLEGSAMLEDDLATVGFFRDLGVAQIHLAYNLDNSVAGGCHGAGIGLTTFGRKVVAEINRVGMIMDCSHSSERTSLEVMEMSCKPVVFSHANVRALKDHPRNLTDAQIMACARTGGVIGLSGVGIFIGDDDIRVESLIRHVDYLADLVGPSYIGLGLDYSFHTVTGDLPEGEDMAKWWPEGYGYDLRNMAYMAPEAIPELANAMLRSGYSSAEVAGVLGQNFARVARATW